MIHVLAMITAKPGQRDAILTHFRANMPAVHAEQGCLHYEPVIDVETSPAPLGPDTFCVVEKWATLADLQAHSRALHMQAYGATVKDLLADRKIHILTAA